MRSRQKWIFAAFLVPLIGLGAGYWGYAHCNRALDSAREHIEKRYQTLFALIERNAADPSLDWRNEDWSRQEELYSEIKQAVPKQAVYFANWTSDGHHGARVLFAQEDWKGYTTYGWPKSANGNRLRLLFRGRSNEGYRLLVFEGHVPEAHKRVYRIAFFEEEALKNEITQKGNVQAPARSNLK